MSDYKKDQSALTEESNKALDLLNKTKEKVENIIDGKGKKKRAEMRMKTFALSTLNQQLKDFMNAIESLEKTLEGGLK